MSKLTDNRRFVWTFENESEFESFIKAEPHHVFGSEKIQWDNEIRIPQCPWIHVSLQLLSEYELCLKHCIN